MRDKKLLPQKEKITMRCSFALLTLLGAVFCVETIRCIPRPAARIIVEL